MFEKYPGLRRKMATFANQDESQRPSYTQIAQILRKANKQWSIQTGPKKGQPWSAKQIATMIQGALQRK